MLHNSVRLFIPKVTQNRLEMCWNSTSGKFGFQHLQVLTNPSVSGSNCNGVGGVGSHCGEKCSKPCDLHKRQHLSVSTGWRKTKGWQVEVSKFICHVFLNQPVKIICRASSKHARAGIFHTSNISEMSFSMAIIWHKRSKTSCFFTDYRITELQNYRIRHLCLTEWGNQTKCIISILLQDCYFIYLFFKIFIQSASVFIGVNPSWASGLRPSSPGLPAKPKPVHRGVCPEQTRGDSHCLSVWLTVCLSGYARLCYAMRICVPVQIDLAVIVETLLWFGWKLGVSCSGSSQNWPATPTPWLWFPCMTHWAQTP